MSKWEIERKWSWSPWEMFVKVSLPELKWAVACSTCPYFLALQCRSFTSLGRNSTQTVEAIKLLWENLANFSSMHSTRPRLQNQNYPIEKSEEVQIHIPKTITATRVMIMTVVTYFPWHFSLVVSFSKLHTALFEWGTLNLIETFPCNHLRPEGSTNECYYTCLLPHI